MLPRSLAPALFFILLPLAPAFSQQLETNQISVWQVRDENNIVYLAGSVHLLRESDLPLPPGYYLAYEDSEHVHFELDMAQISSPEMKVRMLELGMLPGKQRLSFFISDESMKRLRRFARSKGLPPNVMDRLKPGMVILTLSALSAREIGASPDNGVESLIYQRCIQDGKSSSGLETPEFQLSMFDELSAEILEEMINQAMDDTSLNGKKVSELVAAWKTGDAEALNALITDKENPEDETIHEIVIEKRNQNWLPVIEKSIEGARDELFVVGAGHLVGKNGLVELLQKKGYAVTQMSSPRE